MGPRSKKVRDPDLGLEGSFPLDIFFDCGFGPIIKNVNEVVGGPSSNDNPTLRKEGVDDSDEDRSSFVAESDLLFDNVKRDWTTISTLDRLQQRKKRAKKMKRLKSP